MPRSAAVTTVLVDVDRPELVLARDAADTQYLALMVGVEHSSADYLAVPVSRQRLSQLRAGHVDLRTVLEAPETEEWFRGILSAEGEPVLRLEALERPPHDWLPASGFMLSKFLEEETDESDELVRDAIAQNVAMLNCTLYPEEEEAGVIDASRLSTALRLFQNLVRHAFRKSLAEIPQWHRVALTQASPGLLVEAFSPGSFRVRMRAAGRPDLFGVAPVGYGLQRIEELMHATARPDASMELIQQNRGHVISAYRSLMEFIASQHTSFAYQWADPATSRARSARVDPLAAKEMYDILTSRSDLQEEDVKLFGFFVKVDSSRRTWTLRDDEGREHRGYVSEGAARLLHGLTIQSEHYHLSCVEELEEVGGSGEQRTRLRLRDAPAKRR